MNTEIPAELVREARRQLQLPQLAATLRHHLGELPRSVSVDEIDTDLHPRCQMLSHSLRHLGDAGLSVSQYFAIALQQFHAAEQIIRHHPVGRDQLKFLDFACGYGRLLNFLVHALPHDNIQAAEIMPEAVSHVQHRCGIRAWQSTEAPEDFQPDQRYDMIWVASLFSHLPEELFVRWLNRLHALLSDDGILCFTVHDEALLPEDMELPDSGLLYIEGSENADLSPTIYGTSFVNECFVRRALEQATGHDRAYRRFPRLIAYEQDVYMIGRDGRRVPDSMTELRHGLRGWVDGCRIQADGNLHLHGWAASMDGDVIEGVEISLGEQSRFITTGEARPEVASVLGKPELAHCGWSCAMPLPAGGTEPYLTVSARGRLDPPALLYAGPLGTPGGTR
ncbi:class I SAM-dependent methyltransferase [Wenzhouxiangella sp. AB-CW3]|uniref:class I SAM-dependent methyltransferase n=1 Tax=Wenzhouxiangella sp. AB-CW3 TaxID=2771012 RepID=UPI00168B33C0|nr:class I SAM-dependent methyltransferase [Wenzhouxiangella sp. AB-CW3]QOC23129.1 class I SAM-dependent methyltransferase [Wenzhouxiangella sp. AB-CW3]